MENEQIESFHAYQAVDQRYAGAQKLQNLELLELLYVLWT
jgi:hypothetical protein